MKWLRVFESREKALATVEEGKAKLLIIGERKIALARHKNEFFATADKCPHNGESLSKGQVNYLGEIICPWHNYRYNLKHGTECQHRTGEVKTYPIQIKPDGVYIGLPA